MGEVVFALGLVKHALEEADARGVVGPDVVLAGGSDEFGDVGRAASVVGPEEGHLGRVNEQRETDRGEGREVGWYLVRRELRREVYKVGWKAISIEVRVPAERGPNLRSGPAREARSIIWIP